MGEDLSFGQTRGNHHLAFRKTSEWEKEEEQLESGRKHIWLKEPRF